MLSIPLQAAISHHRCDHNNQRNSDRKRPDVTSMPRFINKLVLCAIIQTKHGLGSCVIDISASPGSGDIGLFQRRGSGPGRSRSPFAFYHFSHYISRLFPYVSRGAVNKCLFMISLVHQFRPLSWLCAHRTDRRPEKRRRGDGAEGGNCG
jgi:hypothetical protein